ncbi:CoA-binding protein [Campylobacter majalis]|nr:CoA-binding protein [Campylobacter majalis]
MDEILKNIQKIAIVGLSPDESKASNMVAKYLLHNGYDIYPVYPKYDEILGCKSYKNLSDIKDKIDICVMFRKGEYANDLIHEVIKCAIPTLWLQLGITNQNAKQIAADNAINFIQDKCIKIELQRLKNDTFK